MRKSKKAPEKKVTNIFGKEYVPEEHELDFLFVDECQDLKEDVVGLAADIIEHSRALDLHGDRLYYLEENCFGVDGTGGLKKEVRTLKKDLEADVENMSTLIEVMDCLQKANKAVLEVAMEQDREIKEIKGDLKILDNIWWRTLVIAFIWLLILTGRMCYNVFF